MKSLLRFLLPVLSCAVLACGCTAGSGTDTKAKNETGFKNDPGSNTDTEIQTETDPNKNTDEKNAESPTDSVLYAVAPVMENGLCGYVDENGSIVIEPQFENCGNFSSNGMAPACKDGAYGYIDISGSFVIEPQFGAPELTSDFRFEIY